MIHCNRPRVPGWPKSEYADSFWFILEENFFSSKRDKGGGGGVGTLGLKLKFGF